MFVFTFISFTNTLFKKWIALPGFHPIQFGGRQQSCFFMQEMLHSDQMHMLICFFVSVQNVRDKLHEIDLAQCSQVEPDLVFHHVISEKSQLKFFIHWELQCAYFFKMCFCLYFLNSVCGRNFFIGTVYCVFCESSCCEKWGHCYVSIFTNYFTLPYFRLVLWKTAWRVLFLTRCTSLMPLVAHQLPLSSRASPALPQWCSARRAWPGRRDLEAPALVVW